MASNTSRKGNSAELTVAHHLEAKGWLCASRRHVGGSGDILAVHPRHRTRLVEVKARENVWQGFRKADRIALVETAERYDADPLLAWKKPGESAIVWLCPDQWPGSV